MAFLKTCLTSILDSLNPLALAVLTKSCPNTSKVLARINLASPATPGTPIVMAGTTILKSKKPPHPEHGTKLSFKHKPHKTMGILTIIGIDIKIRVKETAAGSIHVPCR